MTDHPGKAALAAIMEAAEKASAAHLALDNPTINKERARNSLLIAQRNLSDISSANIPTVAALVASLEAENKRLREALNTTLVGGNHLGLVIGADHPHFDATHEDALTLYGPGDKYEAWCAWKAIMYARAALGGDNE